MPPTHTPLFRLLTPLLQNLRLTTKPATTTSNLGASLLKPTSLRPFSSTVSQQAARGGGKNDKKSSSDQRIALIRYHLQHPKTPRPLRLSRLRALRHWTIHRAWMLARRKRMENQEKELYRMYQSMQKACEELRTMDSPGMKNAGRLYRIAMEKKGIFGPGSVPIEYARWQVDTPGKEAWNHEWTR